jgi:hypothetical protein
VTPNPQTISSTRLFVPERYTTVLSPSYVNQILPSGQPIQLTLQLRSPFGGLVHQSGVRVALGQLIYGQAGLIPAQAAINGDPEGQSPVYALTDPTGTARFLLTDHQPQGQPIYFQAWVQPPGGYPFGYSEMVSVVWQSPRAR